MYNLVGVEKVEKVEKVLMKVFFERVCILKNLKFKICVGFKKRIKMSLDMFKVRSEEFFSGVVEGKSFFFVVKLNLR